MNNFNHPVLMFAAGLVVGGGAVALWLMGPLPMPTNPSTADISTSTNQELVPDVSGRVSVKDQAAGANVIVESLTVPPPGVWVTVRETNGSELGNVLGAAHARGPAAGLTIHLLRATLPAHAYAVELFRDDGDGKFDPAKDSVYVDFDTGNPVVTPFRTK